MFAVRDLICSYYKGSLDTMLILVELIDCKPCARSRLSRETINVISTRGPTLAEIVYEISKST